MKYYIAIRLERRQIINYIHTVTQIRLCEITVSGLEPLCTIV